MSKSKSFQQINLMNKLIKISSYIEPYASGGGGALRLVETLWLEEISH